MKRKKGILLSVLAVVLFSGYLSYEFVSEKEKDREPSELNRAESRITEIPATSSDPEPVATPTPMKGAELPLDAETDLLEGIEPDIKKDLLLFTILTGYLGYELVSKKEKNKEPEEMPLDAETDLLEGIELDMNENILLYMGVSKKDFANQIKIFANSIGYAEADRVRVSPFREEMKVNLNKETITIPCYLFVGKQKIIFNAIYQYQKGKWRFVPW